MGFPLLTAESPASSSRFPLSCRGFRIPRRQGWGIIFLFLLLISGRMVRRHMLVGPQDQWKEHLWLDELLQSAEPAQAAEPPAKPHLTSPLPINSCSADSLLLLPGVGPVLADRIDTARRDGAIFFTAGDLQVVKGIGPALSARLAPLVVFAPPARPDTPVDTLPDPDSIPDISR